MDYAKKRFDYGVHYFSTALLAFSFSIILLFPPINQAIMRASGSYVIYMAVFSIIIGLAVYIMERLMADVFGYTIDGCVTP